MARNSQYPLYGYTYNLYRLSPLYNRKAPLLHHASLAMHARRMREILKGDVVRGVQVDVLVEGSIASLGPLEDCTWDLIGDETAWNNTQKPADTDEDADDLSQLDTREIQPEDARGILIRLKYATSMYTAMLLKDPKETKSPQGFTYLPLLLLRMPTPLRNVIIEQISSTFDTRVSPMRLRPFFLLNSFESLLARLTSPDSNQSVPDIVKQLLLQLSFPAVTSTGEQAPPAHLLKHIDINISRDDIYEFYTRGNLLLSRSPEVYSFIEKRSPFTAGLVHYLSSYLAFEPIHIHPAISKITNALFSLSTDGKMKLFPPTTRASGIDESSQMIPEISASELFMQDFYKSLIKEATGDDSFQQPG